MFSNSTDVTGDSSMLFATFAECFKIHQTSEFRYEKGRIPMIEVKHTNLLLCMASSPFLSLIASGLKLFGRSLHTSLLIYSRFLTGYCR